MRTTHLKTLLGAMIVALATTTGTWGISQAAPPAGGTTPYVYSGTVDHIDNERNAIVIDDREFGLPVNVAVRSGTTTLSRNSLSKRMRVGFNLTGHTVSEIWILSRR